MIVLVVGPGAVGSLLGGLLAGAGHDVRLLGPGRSPAGALAAQGQLVLCAPGGSRRSVGVTRLDDPGAMDVVPDLVILAVRQMDLASALDAVAAWPRAPTLTIQNGIGAEELTAGRRPAAPLLAASLTAPVDVPAPGEVRWLSRGGLGLALVGGGVAGAAGGVGGRGGSVGRGDGGEGGGAASMGQGDVDALVEALRRDLTAAGLRTAVYGEAGAMKWSKLVANLVANATGAILDMGPADIYGDGRLYEIERRQLLEALAVMRRLGHHPVALPGARVPWLALAARSPSWLGRPILARIVSGARGGKMPSLRAHVREAGGPSEVAWLNGAVARTGASLGVPTPVNAGLAALVDRVIADPVRREWHRERPDRLVAALALG